MQTHLLMYRVHTNTPHTVTVTAYSMNILIKRKTKQQKKSIKPHEKINLQKNIEKTTNTIATKPIK